MPLRLRDLSENTSITKNNHVASVSPSPQAVTLGTDVVTDSAITLGDMERCGGLYILGQPRTGKSNLLISLALSDIENGYGLIFIDPHTDAINDLLARIPSCRQQDVILLDPTNRKWSFGINLLHCTDPSDPLELDKTYGRVRNIFAKVWGDQNGQLGVWLEKVLRNSVYLLLENPGYTLVEIPLLLSEDTRFRNALLENITINPYVKDFWYYEFDRLSRRDKTEQVGPALSRLEIFRTSTMIRHIVGQRKATIDFYNILNGANTQHIILLRMPTQLPSDIKTLIGTMILSEIVNAAFDRDQLSETERRFFGLFCDEFQEFATPDFAKLFTQTGKYRIMPAVAHQERLGQFKPNDPNRGATLAAPNKVLFTLSVPDAGGLALEFAREPPTKTEREQQLVISQNPVSDLLNRGHKNPEILAFVNKYLRHMHDRREDIKEEMDGERLKRMAYLDQAGLYMLDERLESVESNDRVIRHGILERRGSALAQAKRQTGVLLNLFHISKGLRLTERGLNTLLTGVMEGRIAWGQEQFSDFLITLVHGFAGIESEYAQTLEFHIALSYGDQTKRRTIPCELARLTGLYSEEVALLTYQSNKQTAQEREAFQDRFVKEKEERGAYWRSEQKKDKLRLELKRKKELIEWRHRRIGGIRVGLTSARVGGVDSKGSVFLSPKNRLWNPPNMYARYVWWLRYSYLCKALVPYEKARFNGVWRSLMPGQSDNESIAKGLKAVKVGEYEPGTEEYMRWFKARTVKDLKGFLNKYQEGAFVILALLDCAACGCWGEDMAAYNMSLSEFPGIEGKDPMDVWCLIETLRGFMSEILKTTHFTVAFYKYFESHYLWLYKLAGMEEAGFWTSMYPHEIYNRTNNRQDVKTLEAVLKERWRWFAGQYRAAADRWGNLNECQRYYLLCRAADRLSYEAYQASYGEEYKSLPPSTNPSNEAVVDALVALSRDTQAQLDEAEDQEEAARERKRIEAECAEEVAKISYSPPELLEPRVLSGNEIQELRLACIKQLHQADQQTQSVAATIDENGSP